MFTRTVDTVGAITVNYSIGGTAANGSDHSLGTSDTVAFADGFSTAYVYFPTTDDSTSEPTETLVFTLTSGTGYTIGTSDVATVNLFDNDAQVVTVEKVVDATEGGNGTFRFTRTGDLSSSLTANYSVSGTATSGTDYTALGGTVTFLAGHATAEVNVTAGNDNVYDPDETVTVTVTVTSGTGYTVGTEDEAETIIVDSALVTFTLESVDGGAKYDLPWGDVDPEEATQSLALTNFALYIGGQTITNSNATFTVSPTAQFEYGVFVGLTFEIDTSSVGGGFAYTSVSMSGLGLTAQPLVGMPLFVAAQKKQTAVTVDFKSTASTEAYNLYVEITWENGDKVGEFVSVPANTSGANIRDLVWTTLDDLTGVKPTMSGETRLVVKGNTKLLAKIEFTAPKNADKTDNNMKYLSATPQGTQELTPKTYVNGTEIK